MKIREKILVIEDEQTIRNFMQAVLTANDYDVLLARTGAMGESMIASHCPDVIILDLGLPDVDGMEILRKVRRWSKVPIVVVSARTHERDKVEALDAGVKVDRPRIINSDQGSLYTSNLYIERIRAESESSSISMDGRGRCMDNIFTERFWRSYKQEEVYLKEYESPREARRSTAEYIKHYNFDRPHQSLNYRTPWDVYSGGKAGKVTIR